ncbi:MAG TPA: Trm112 family protein [Gemmatimonadales bacterium]|nr:Trm112 family protein [Gemmatimonadales bacterium]
MFIELTDHLRCPADHPEAFLVLLPDEVVDRTVRAGVLGCPVCRREYRIRDGVAELHDEAEAIGVDAGSRGAPIDGSALAAFLGLGGPGGYVVLVGTAADRWEPAAEAMGGVHLVAVNPTRPVPASLRASPVRAGRIPLKARSVRGVVLGAGYAADPAWRREAIRVTLPGLRVVGESAEPPGEEGIEPLASAGGWWVARRR